MGFRYVGFGGLGLSVRVSMFAVVLFGVSGSRFGVAGCWVSTFPTARNGDPERIEVSVSELPWNQDPPSTLK